MSNKSFVDIVYITVQSGDGGNGAVSFRREKYVPKGGPDGGNGGRGGHVIFQGVPHLHSLNSLVIKKYYRAENGFPGGKTNKHGKDGQDIVLTVPYGTIIKDTQSHIIASITKEDNTMLLLRGGKGGKGNAYFKSSTRQTPRFSQEGESGLSLDLICELEIIAHVGLIGIPNAGKSTMLRALTKANPKIDSYPFTTLHPNLGVLRNYEKELIIADIPGLIEGASHGEGLGLRFLKHCKKTKLLVFVLDSLLFLQESELQPHNIQNAMQDLSTHLFRQYIMLMKELHAYDTSLTMKPKMIIINKIDACHIDMNEEEHSKLVSSLDTMIQHHKESSPQEKEYQSILCCSSHVGVGISELKNIVINFDTQNKSHTSIAAKTEPNTP